MIDNDLDTDDHGTLSAVSGALVDRPGSSDGSRSPTKNVRSSPYSTKDVKTPMAESNVPRLGLSQEDQEQLASSVVEQMQRLMNHLEGGLQTDRAQIQQDQGMDNQTLVEHLVSMQQESNTIRKEGLILRQDLQQIFASPNDQQLLFRSEIDQLHQQNQLLKQEKKDISMADVPTKARGNLSKQEYRSGIYPESQSTTIPPVMQEYVAYTQPGANPPDNRAPETPNHNHARQSPSILPDTPMFVGDSQSRSTASWKLHKLPPPPKFEIKHLDGLLLEVRFWRELYRHIADDQVLACLGINGSEEVKDILMDFLGENHAASGNLTFEGVPLKIQKEFGAVNDIAKTEKLHQIMSFKKKADCDIRKLRRRFKRLRLLGRQAGIEMGGSILFTHSITALSLTSAQRHMVLSFFENSHSEKNATNLLSITVRLFGHYTPDPVGTYLEENIVANQSIR